MHASNNELKRQLNADINVKFDVEEVYQQDRVCDCWEFITKVYEFQRFNFK